MLTGYFIDIITAYHVKGDIEKISDYDKTPKNYKIEFDQKKLISKLISDDEIIKCRLISENKRQEGSFLHNTLIPKQSYEFKFVTPSCLDVQFYKADGSTILQNEDEVPFDQMSRLNIYEDGSVEMYIIGTNYPYMLMYSGKIKI